MILLLQYVSQCPIPAGSSFTYKFKVNEMPGTYFWHDHSSINRADGLQGALIVKAKPGTPELAEGKIQDTFILFLQDWWHTPANALAMRLNRYAGSFMMNEIYTHSLLIAQAYVQQHILSTQVSNTNRQI